MDRPLVTDAESGRVARLLAHPKMTELVADRRRFFGYAWTVFLGSAVVLFGWAAFAPRGLGVMVADGLSLGLVLGVAYLGVIFVLTVQYARRARRWDELVAELRADAGLPRRRTEGDR
ncbi:DUF485 domain-containing protein [Pseudonocardia acaciae]|uniref:DUF485 domain-containing protein n=1 Tax=Pseudonocardia acaciae TaxID=551276 RepID=UPI0007E8CC27|nr:DUF485 domain-containing protein [Pseudonocardia acaciae]